MYPKLKNNFRISIKGKITCKIRLDGKFDLHLHTISLNLHQKFKQS